MDLVLIRGLTQLSLEMLSSWDGIWCVQGRHSGAVPNRWPGKFTALITVDLVGMDGAMDL